jgi:hypothetical protein
MGSSPGFGSTSTHFIALFRLAFAAAPPHGLTLRVNVSRWLIMQKARSHPLDNIAIAQLGLLPLVSIRFQVLFHSPNRRPFHLSLTVLVLYRSRGSI